MAVNLNPVRTLLGDMAQDEYVRFKYGKRLDAALKVLDQAGGAADPAALEAKLLEALALVRGEKKGAGATAPGAKSRKRAAGQPELPAVPPPGGVRAAAKA